MEHIWWKFMQRAFFLACKSKNTTTTKGVNPPISRLKGGMGGIYTAV